MEFKEGRGIYLQIVDHLADRMLARQWGDEGRLPSIREVAAELWVNPNTVMRSYGFLQDRGIIINKRGIGFFIAPEGRHRILAWKKDAFIHRELPSLFKDMEQLDLTVGDLKNYYREYKERDHETD